MRPFFEGACHCGAVAFELSATPAWLVDCNCSACRRYGALWGHIAIEDFHLTRGGPTLAYTHGDRMLAFHTCKTCGCLTHWSSETVDGKHMAANFRMCDPDTIEGLRVRAFDGADSWAYLDDAPEE